MKNDNFDRNMNNKSNQRSDNYIEIISELLHCIEEFGASMSIQIHFLRWHLNYFPHNYVDYIQEQGEIFHQDIATMENRYKGPMQ